MKKLLLYTLSIFLCTFTFAQEKIIQVGIPNRVTSDTHVLHNDKYSYEDFYTQTNNLKFPNPINENSFLLMEEINEDWDGWEATNWRLEDRFYYTYDIANNNLIEKLHILYLTDNEFVNHGKTQYYYNENNLLAEELLQGWDTVEWTNSGKQNYFYDENENIIEERVYSWSVNSEWRNYNKFIHIYDENNNLEQTLKYNWWNSSSWENEKKFSYLYDNDNNLIEEVRQDWNGNDWANYWKIVYLYDENSNAVEILRQHWSDTEWVNIAKNIFTFDDESNPILILGQIWDGSGWVDNRKIKYSYDQNNNQIKMWSQGWFEYEDQAYWLNSHKNTYYYLPANAEWFVAKNTSIDKPIEDFQTTDDDIVIESGRDDQTLIGVEVLIDSVIHTSDRDLEFTLSHNGISETIIYQAGGNGENFIGTKLTDNGIDTIAKGKAPFVGIYKPENPLSPFTVTDPSGVWTLSIYDGVAENTGTLYAWGLVLIFNEASGIEDETAHWKFDLYPNPAGNELRVAGYGLRVGGVAIEIYDINGRKLLNKTIPKGSEEMKINVSHLQSGLYFCRISTGEYSVTKKLIVQK